jgi:hypothetical protein
LKAALYFVENKNYDFLLGDQVFSSLYKGVSCTSMTKMILF